MSSPSQLTAQLIEYVRTRHPRSLPGVLEARSVDPERFEKYSGMFLTWATTAFGPSAIEQMVDDFVRFSTDVNFAQARYEASGHYDYKSYKECEASVYSQGETMREYLSGIFLTNFLWAHHMEISLLFEQRFVARLGRGTRIVEIAPGHGGWGLWALHASQDTRLEGFDISPMAIEMARRLATASELQHRAHYTLKDAMQIEPASAGQWDACICSFLIEHLEQPDRLLEIISRLLRPGGRAFLTGALTAAQVDHIYEFRDESELVGLSERHGLRVAEMRSVGPRRTLRRARFLPRSAALILEKGASPGQ